MKSAFETDFTENEENIELPESFSSMNEMLKKIDLSKVDTIFSGKEKIGFELWTPEISLYQLRHNSNNRNKRITAYKKYIKDMLEKKFGLSGDCIIIDTTGNLLNGQNRCEAIVKSGKPQVVVALRNVLPDSRKWENKGAKQNNPNHSQMYLKPICKEFKDDMWGVICRILAYKNHCKQHEYSDEIDIVEKFAKDNLELLKEINKIKTRTIIIRNNPLFKALIFLFMEENKEKAMKFCKMVLDGVAPVNSAPWALIRWNQELTEHSQNHGEDAAEVSIIMAWDAFKKGAKLKRIKVYKDEKELNPVTGEYSKNVLKSEYNYENYCKTK